jgi:hypothetical protein
MDAAEPEALIVPRDSLEVGVQDLPHRQLA